MASYLMHFHRLTGELQITEFSDSAEAMQKRLELEHTTDDPNIEIVVINSPSLEQLKVSHSRYFAPETRSRSIESETDSQELLEMARDLAV